ncbi:hypothetical protein DFA_06803 [Cavenderia fasciculata]|uniref:Monalysin Pore-forming domain-containing protein n=1 Tax=Cavenderia fasciculata TaxID=261658 RepID=F4Q2B6_CACFS|nr:uncharacterized protein DFA_06803 [Cavenderia fasciculata]EGG18136.1 hypothetical protein DFA_06803 [Cavenderia fasciculata]|eukprot:XP_004366177.1 hypothetical protein DFA_06803 [Cavenderia fasciculata]
MDTEINKQLLNQFKEPFDLENSLMVATEMGVDKELKFKNPIEMFVMLNFTFDYIALDINGVFTFCKPIAVFNQYLGNANASSKKSVTVKCFKGSETYPIPTGRGQLIDLCEKKLLMDVKNHFNYGYNEILQAVEIDKTIELPSAGSFAIFQTKIIYGYRFRKNGVDQFEHACVFRDDVSLVPIDHIQYEPVTYHQYTPYLTQRY